MKIRRITMVALLCIGATIFLTSCASTDAEDYGRRELPWNSQQGWENQGVIGGFARGMSRY
ncbi:MAG: hypothetical protein ACFCU3_11130 [Verrucomicrobiales bacterium]